MLSRGGDQWGDLGRRILLAGFDKGPLLLDEQLGDLGLIGFVEVVHGDLGGL